MADEKLGTGRDDPQPVDLSEALLDALGNENGGFVERDPETFTASQIGFCPRQCYVRKLGLTDTSDIQGRFSAGHLVRTRLTEALAEADSTLETNPSISFESGDVRFIGRCTAYDPVSDVVYHIRTRNGWYKFHPPVDRHVDQLHVYGNARGKPRRLRRG